MRGIPVKARIFIILVFTSGCLLAWGLLTVGFDTQVRWEGVLLFLVLTILSDSLPVALPRGGEVTVSFALVFASIFLFPPLISIIIAVAGYVFSTKKEHPIPLYKYLINTGQLSISVGLAALTYHQLSTRLEPDIPSNLIPILAALILDIGLNTGLVTLAIAFLQEVSPWAIWVTNIRWALPNFTALAPLGVLIALIFRSAGWVGVLLFFIPLLIARHSFQSFINMRESFLDTIHSLAAAIDAKDPYTHGHSERVARYCVAIAHKLGWPEDRVEMLEYIAVLHDTGKIGIPEDILNKPGRLSKEEFERMQTHSEIGAGIIAKVKLLGKEAGAIRHHHEKWDGQGYPDWIAKEEIPLSARIIAVADAFDAMTSDRPYRLAMSPEVALEEVKRCAGSQFDPKIVKAFIDVFPTLGLVIEKSPAVEEDSREETV